MSKQILILPGDGIGPEIMAEAVKVLKRIDAQHGLGFQLVYDELGGTAYDKYGSPLADETLERARGADAVLLGAVGGPQWDTIDPALRRAWVAQDPLAAGLVRQSAAGIAVSAAGRCVHAQAGGRGRAGSADPARTHGRHLFRPAAW